MNYITNTYPSRSVFLPAFRWDSSWSFRAFLWRPKGMFVFPINSIPSGVSVYPSPLQNRVQQGSNGSIRKQPYHPHPLPLSPFTHPLSPETEYFSSVLLKVEPPHFPNVVILCCLSCSSSSFPHQRLRPLCPKHLSGILYTMYAMTLGWEWDQRRTTMDDTSSCPNWILLRILQHCDAMIITRTVDAFTIPTGRHQCQSKRMDMKGIKSGGQRTHQLWIPWNIVAGQDGFARDIPVLQWLSGCQFFQSRSFWWSEEMRSFLFLQKSSHVMSFHPIYFPQFLLISCFI